MANIATMWWHRSLGECTDHQRTPHLGWPTADDRDADHRALRRARGGARACCGPERGPDAWHPRALSRAADLGDRARRVVPGAVDCAPPRWRLEPAPRLGRHL